MREIKYGGFCRQNWDRRKYTPGRDHFENDYNESQRRAWNEYIFNGYV
jgi:hypothetical protein